MRERPLDRYSLRRLPGRAVKAILWLGPEDGRELDAPPESVRRGEVLVPDNQENARLLAGEPVFDGHAHGRYELRTAPDGIADLDTAGRLVFDWKGWE